MVSLMETASTVPPAMAARGHVPQHGGANVGETERGLSMVVGGALLAVGLMRRLPGGLLLPLAGAALLHRGWSGRCAVYEAVGYDGARQSSPGGVAAQHGRRVTWAVHINRDAKAIYDVWRDIGNLPRIMRHLVSVTPLDEKRSHWIAQGPLRRTIEWDAEIINDQPGELIAWSSLSGSQVDTAGSVQFRTPAFREGTELVVSLKYDPPGGQLVAAAAEFLGQGLEAAIEQDLRAFKQLMEAGELATAQPRVERNRPQAR
jgi:uncharacterized membrane protein